jgi:nucleoside-diphosphate-sugar epimerase
MRKFAASELRMDKAEISILGCGWLGLPLAEALIKAGYNVNGSTTTPEKFENLAALNIQPFLLDLNSPESLASASDFFKSEILIINVPPRRNSGNAYLLQIENLKKALTNSSVKKVLFVSSTSVYKPDLNTITEESELAENEAAELIAAEKTISVTENPWQTTILRFAGLFGPNRQPGRFLAGKTNLPEPIAPVNLIHLTDCIGIIQEIIKQEKWNKIYNASAEEHPSRQEFYTKAARKLGLPEPTFAKEKGTQKPGKLISSQKVKTDLNYQFQYPDPLKAI